tara:strand:+ start:511 stop:837 length:327 start_codon:yes stop_codon:yes gene_type:complete
MNYTLKEVCNDIVALMDLNAIAKVSKSLPDKALKASEQLGMSLSVYGKNKLRLRKADHSTITYTDIPVPQNKETQTLILTHAILTHKLHDKPRTNQKDASLTRRSERL